MTGLAPGAPPPGRSAFAFRTLRLSVTDRCNFRCRYCMPAGAHPRFAGGAPLQVLVEAAHWLVHVAGVRRIKITGGEPLVRRGLPELVRALAGDGVEVSLTSNGALLALHARALADAGLARVNVSLDTTDPARFARLSRGGRVADTLAGIDAALAAGLRPVKLNAVLHRSGVHETVAELLDFAAGRGLEVRFIELMCGGVDDAWQRDEFIAAGEVQEWLAREGTLHALPGPDAAPARRTAVSWRGHEVTVGWITPRSQPFCGACDRLRLDARGRLRRCLMDPATLPLHELRRGRGAEAARAELDAFLAGKRAPRAMDARLPMSAIGG